MKQQINNPKNDFSRELIIYNITIENIHNTLRAVDLNILKNDVENYFNDNFGINFKIKILKLEEISLIKYILIPLVISFFILLFLFYIFYIFKKMIIFE